MTKRFLSALLAALCLLTLAACGCKHENWTEADCVNPRICADCGEYEGIPNGHIWHPADCTNEKYCDTCGKTADAALGHDWADATCSTPRTCTRCGLTEGEPLPHTWVDADCDTPQTCSVCGATEGDPLGHTWISATLETPKTCSVCDATEGEPLTSIFDSDISHEVQKALSSSMASLSPVYTFSDEQALFTITLTAPKGTAEALGKKQASTKESWKTMVSQCMDLTGAVRKAFAEAGYEIHCCIMVLNDANTSNTLLTLLDDEVVYNVLDYLS